MYFCKTKTLDFSLDGKYNGLSYEWEVQMNGKNRETEKDSPKLKSVTIRLSDDEYEKFIKYAASHNMTMTQALLKGIELLYQNS